MAITRQTMTDEQRKSVALEYLKAFDNKGVTSSGGSILDLFADDAQVFFPKWGLATGKKQIGQLFTDFGGGIKSDPARLRHVQLDHDRHRCVRGGRARAPVITRTARGERACRMPVVGATSSRSATS